MIGPFPDVSFWQGEVDWKVVAKKAYGAFIRAGQGVGTIDGQFARNWQMSKDEGVARGAYWYFKMDKDGRKQAESAWALFPGGYNGEFPLAIDMEETLPVGIDKFAMASAYEKFVVNWKKLSGGMDLITYTRQNWWDYNFPPKSSDAPKQTFLWIAQYFSRVTAIPREWLLANKSWLFWQYSADGNMRGNEFGAQSYSIDLNWCALSLEELNKLFKTHIVAPIDNPQPPPPPVPVTKIEVPIYTTKGAMNVRDAAGISGKLYFTLPAGSRLEGLDEIKEGDNVWVRCGQRQYAAKVYNGVTLLA